ncbi:hypothetical protein ACFLU3_05600 [Chloroflexota bacterium]
MDLKVKPVIVVGPMWPLIPQPDGSLALSTDDESISSTIERIDARLREKLASEVSLLETSILRQASDIDDLQQYTIEADALFVYVAGLMPFEELWSLPLPIIAFSGDYTPMMGLYAFPIEVRECHINLEYCLDYEEVMAKIRLLAANKRLMHTKITHIGLPVTFDGHWEHIPDPGHLMNRLGVEIIPVTSAEFMAEKGKIEDSDAADVVQSWLAGATEVDGPSSEEMTEVAKVYLAFDSFLERTGAQAVAVGCLELMYQCGLVPHCFALSQLRDRGIPAACESDIIALLTMIMLDYLTNKPAYMGNVVRANPTNNQIMISHGCTPSRMAGLDQPPTPYKLVHSYSGQFHSGSGLTSLPNIEKRQEVTITRIARNLDRIFVTTGEIVDFRETLLDRGTMDIQVKDARKFFHNAPGNHHVVVYGNHIEQLRELSQLLSIELIES